MVIRPKRRKDKDNPYTISFNDIDNIYIVSFKDGSSKNNEVVVNKEIYDFFNAVELEDLHQLNIKERHIDFRTIDGSEEMDNIIFNKMKDRYVSIDEDLINKEIDFEIKSAINMLSDIQKNRIIKYYFMNKTEEEIAIEENVSQVAIHKSIKDARNKLKEILKIRL